MDRKTERVLGQISQSIPEHLQRNVLKTVTDDSEEKLADELIKHPSTSARTRNQVRRLKEKGAFRRSEVVEDENVTQQIGAYNERMVKDAIKKGLIPHPDTDPYIRKMNRRVAERDERLGEVQAIPKAIGKYVMVRRHEWPWKKPPGHILVLKEERMEWAVGYVRSIGHEVKDMRILGCLVLFRIWDGEEIFTDVFALQEKDIQAIVV